MLQPFDRMEVAMDEFMQATRIAESAHAGQVDKTGKPYVEHCRRVASRVDGSREKIVAMLHDVIEKSRGWDSTRLLAEGFPPEIVSAVDALSRRPGEDERDFIARAYSDSLARPVKRADLEDNLMQARHSNGDTARYEEGLRILDDLQEAEAQPDAPPSGNAP